MENIYSCADYVVELASEYGIEANPRLINQVLFYTYVEYAAKHSIQLFKENFCAWTFGPTLPQIWDCYSEFGKPSYILTRSYAPLSNDSLRTLLAVNFNRICDKDITRIEENSKSLKHKNSPWKNHRMKQDEIPFEEIKDFYAVVGNYQNYENLMKPVYYSQEDLQR